MPPKSTTPTNSPSQSETQPKDKTQVQMFQESGFASFQAFGVHYGLDTQIAGQYEQAQSLLSKMKEKDQELWEAEQTGMKGEFEK